jgi:hypothetical protein
MALFVSKRAKGDGREAVPPGSAASAGCLNPEGVTLPLPPAQAGGLRKTRAPPSPRMGATDNSPAFQRWFRTRPCGLKPRRGDRVRFAGQRQAPRDGRSPSTEVAGAPCFAEAPDVGVAARGQIAIAQCPPALSRARWLVRQEVSRPSGAKGVLIRPRDPALKRWAIVCPPLSGA